MNGPGIHEQRYWVGAKARYLMLIPMAMSLAGLYACTESKKELLAGTPLLGMLAYGCAVMVWGRFDVRVDNQGFRVAPGPMPTGARAEEHRKEEVKHLFPRHLRESEGRNNIVDNYYAAVELQDGRWVNLRGPYKDWGAASFACKEIAAFWRWPVIEAGRSGFAQGYRDWGGAKVTLLWGVAFIVALLWGAWVEISGWGR